jgi:23S rRNA pseudouridine1911/1915/1917 synthase
VLKVGPEDSGRRLDLFLADALRLSRAQTRRLLARGAVQIGGRDVAAAAKGQPVRAGEVVAVAPFTRPESQRAIPRPDLPLSVLAEGPGWLVVDKPAGMPVHPLEEGEDATVLNALIARRPEVHGVGEGALRSGVVHRLDVDTSGALLLATREDTWQRLRAAFREHRVDKTYRAIVLGDLEGGGRIELPLVTARHRPARVRVARDDEVARGARPAALAWRPLEKLRDATLVEVRPVTGHLHQIRVTFAHLGHPVAGDRAYGPASDPTGAARQMLHAAAVAFEEVGGASPDPADFAALLAAARPT